MTSYARCAGCHSGGEARPTASSGSMRGKGAASCAAPAPIWKAATGQNGWGNAEREYDAGWKPGQTLRGLRRYLPDANV